MKSEIEAMDVDMVDTHKKLKRPGKHKNKNKRKKQRLSDETKLNAEQSEEDVVRKNKTRVLVFSRRNVSFIQRHFLKDIKSLMPHSKSETKMGEESGLFIINEMCEMRNCNKCIFLEANNMWISNVPAGPSAKFIVENIYTISELKLTGNILKGSRSLLSFDKNFETEPHWLLAKELFTQVFGVPKYHPKSKPIVDHVMTFSIVGDRVWIRNYQIVEENGELAEIGPRFTLNPVKIFKGSFSGETLFDNPQFIPISTITDSNSEVDF